MYLSIVECVEKEAVEGLTIDPASLYCAFEQVRDGRKAKGTRYPLPLLLTLLLLGKLAGATGINGIVDWVNERAGWVRPQLNCPTRLPTNSSYSRTFAPCHAEPNSTVLALVPRNTRCPQAVSTE